jgi:hypothetical protein
MEELCLVIFRGVCAAVLHAVCEAVLHAGVAPLEFEVDCDADVPADVDVELETEASPNFTLSRNFRFEGFSERTNRISSSNSICPSRLWSASLNSARAELSVCTNSLTSPKSK